MLKCGLRMVPRFLRPLVNSDIHLIHLLCYHINKILVFKRNNNNNNNNKQQLNYMVYNFSFGTTSAPLALPLFNKNKKTKTKKPRTVLTINYMKSMLLNIIGNLSLNKNQNRQL
jgi:hypothetical protein